MEERYELSESSGRALGSPVLGPYDVGVTRPGWMPPAG
jgi:hypothetical protein